MTTVKEVYDILDKFCPFNAAMDFDNIGLLIGNFRDAVKNILVALDVTDDVIAEAKSIGANLIVSHHPIIFNPLKNIYSDDIPYKLIKNDINVICAHTNLDVARGGVNDSLAESLTLLNPKPLSYYQVSNSSFPLGVVGDLECFLSSIEFANFVKRALHCNGLKFTNISNEKYISKVAICSGSGGNLIKDAAKMRADAFLTGEIKHHELLFAIKNNITVVDVGHFQSENIIVRKVAELLNGKFRNVRVYMSQKRADKIEYI